MNTEISVLMAQINPLVGAIEANCKRIISIITTHQANHDVIIFPELVLTGYPPEDLLFHETLFERIENAINEIKTHVGACYVIIGYPTLEEGKRYNSAGIFYQHQLMNTYHKQKLPNYGVFDEKRYFTEGENKPCLLTVKNLKIGVCICEDVWQKGPIEQLIAANAQWIACLNASPFHQHKYNERQALFQPYLHQDVGFIYVNMVGGQDELVFDGQSIVIEASGEVSVRAPAFKEALHPFKLKNQQACGNKSPLLSQEALTYQALVCGLRDYVHKNHFPGVLLGLSGGIDSALTLALAVDALGAKQVHAVMMPSPYSASISLEDAITQSNTLQVSYSTLPITPAFHTLLDTLAPLFKETKADITEENIQARIRGVLLMALSNKTKKMVLSTSNKSETAVGYTTLYGDMAGGFAVLKDVLKTEVYTLAHYRNSLSSIIPDRVLTRAPSAELAANQTDQDTLPDYAILDAIIHYHMEQYLDAQAIIKKGFDKHIVERVLTMIHRNEYKRRQAPPGVKITPRAFGKDWRYPITSYTAW